MQRYCIFAYGAHEPHHHLPRTLASFLRVASTQFSALVLTGARQVGKTTLLRDAADASRSYVTLDDPTALSLARAEPQLFLERFPGPTLIDEIQYAPELLPAIKMAVDKQGAPGLYWLTGSQPFHLMRGVSESLAGHGAVICLASAFMPLSAEIEVVPVAGL